MTRIKDWKMKQIMHDVCKFGSLWENIYVERTDDAFQMPFVDEEGYQHIESRVTVLKETEKAYYVDIAESWKTWVPKSTIILEA